MEQYETRQFMIISTSEVDKIDFNQVLETSEETLRVSLDGLKTFIKWDGEITPSSIQSIIIKQGPYSYSEMLNILSESEWSNHNPNPNPLI